MFTSPEPSKKNPREFSIYFYPYTFRGADRPHGFSYCFRNSSGECVFHGIIFAPAMIGPRSMVVPRAEIARELPEPLNQWAEAGHVPYLPAGRPIGQVGACNRPAESRGVYSRQWIRPPGKNATDAARRIYAARMRAREQRESKGQSHV
jgi:hypothetical protein